MTIWLAQLNFIVGDIISNTKKIIETIDHAEKKEVDLIVFPELAITGYPPEDLLLRHDFIDSVERGLKKIQEKTENIAIILGHPHKAEGVLYNAASFFYKKKRPLIYYKQCLPNYAVFDEKRYFSKGNKAGIFNFNEFKIGLNICEDLWHADTAQQAKKGGAELLISLNASPFHQEQPQKRLDVLTERIHETGLPILYVNLVGGQDELIFDGNSLVLDAQGKILIEGRDFHEDILSVNLKRTHDTLLIHSPGQAKPKRKSSIKNIYEALVLGTRDYIKKNHFSGALIGLSGGIDSALTLAIASDALGSDSVQAVMMPSPYTSTLSLICAEEQAHKMNIQYRVISIISIFYAFLESLKSTFKHYASDITEENLQARCRAVLLMALSNKTKQIVLTTNNKSEMATGYSTLYGDMAGGFAPLKDVYKTEVYKLAHYRNQLSSIIPQAVIERPPTAELAPNQTDQDTLPPYEILDQILKAYIESDRSIFEIVKMGFSEATVKKVVERIHRNEYKRGQSPRGIRITQRAFGKDWRWPITSGFNPMLF